MALGTNATAALSDPASCVEVPVGIRRAFGYLPAATQTFEDRTGSSTPMIARRNFLCNLSINAKPAKPLLEPMIHILASNPSFVRPVPTLTPARILYGLPCTVTYPIPPC
jgi:hypothetical protein